MKELLQRALSELEHVRIFVTSREKMHPTGVALFDELITDLRAAIAAKGESPNYDWMTPTTHKQRLSDALCLLCNGNRPPMEIIDAWHDASKDDFRLQDWCVKHGPQWAQGIGVIDAAFVLAEQPTEGVEHELSPAKAEGEPVAHHPSAAEHRNYRKVVRALADSCFGGPDDPKYGHCHVALTTSMTAKDGLDFSTIDLEPLYTSPPTAEPIDAPPWEDRPDEWTEACEEAHPMNAGSSEHWETAMKMVGNRHSKYALVGLVAWLLHLAHSVPGPAATSVLPTAEPMSEPSKAPRSVEDICAEYIEDVRRAHSSAIEARKART